MLQTRSDGNESPEKHAGGEKSLVIRGVVGSRLSPAAWPPERPGWDFLHKTRRFAQVWLVMCGSIPAQSRSFHA